MRNQFSPQVANLKFKVRVSRTSYYLKFPSNQTISELIDFFEQELKNKDFSSIISFTYNGSIYNRESTGKLNTIFRTNQDNEITINFAPTKVSYPVVKNITPARYDGQTDKQPFTVRFLDLSEKIISFKSPYNVTELKRAIRKDLSRQDRKVSLALYTPDGQHLNDSSSYSEYLKRDPSTYLLYVIRDPYDFVYSNEKLDSPVSAIETIIAKADKDYSTLLACILYYIQNHGYKANNIVEAIRETCQFTPFACAIWTVYHTQSLDDPLLFCITSYLFQQYRDKDGLSQYFSVASTFQCAKDPSLIDTEQFQIPNAYGNLLSTYGNQSQFSPLMISNSLILSLTQSHIIFKYYVGKNDVGYCISTSDNKIGRVDEGISQIIKYYDPVSPSETAQIELNTLRNFDETFDIPINPSCYDQITFAFIDYSSTMLVASDERGTRRGQIAVNIINKMAQASKDLGLIDPFFVFKTNRPTKLPLQYDKTDFLNVSSDFWFSLGQIIEYIQRYFPSKDMKRPIRIIAVTDGAASDDYTSYARLSQQMMDLDIKLDLIVLNKNTNSYTISAVSHLTRGLCFNPSTENEAYKVAELETLVNLSKRPQMPMPGKYSSLINERFIYEISKSRYFEDIDEIASNEYTNKNLFLDALIWQNHFHSEFDGLRVFREHDIIAQISLYTRSKKKGEIDCNIFSYCIQNTLSNQIMPNKILVFVEGKDIEDKTLYFPILITFPTYYPLQCPSFRVLGIPMDHTASNGFIKWDWDYSPNKTVYQLLYKKRKYFKAKHKKRDLPRFLRIVEPFMIDRFYHISLSKLPSEQDYRQGESLYKRFVERKK